MKVRYGTLEDRPEIVRISKQSRYTKGVTNPMFLNEDTYERGEVGIAESSKHGVVGFVVVRHLVRRPLTRLHYVGVDERFRSRRVGERLCRWVQRTSPHRTIQLLCEKENTRAHQFYHRLGYQKVGEGANKAGQEHFIFELSW